MADFISPFSEEKKQIDRATEHCLKYACQGSGTAAQISASIVEEKRLVVEANQLHLANTLRSHELVLTLHRNSKKGSVKTNSLDLRQLEDAVRTAEILANFSVADPHLNFASPEMAPPARQLDFLYDPKVGEVGFEDLKQTMQELLDLVRSNSRITIDRMEIVVETARSSIANTLGVKQDEGSSAIEWSFSGMALEEDDVSGFDYDSGFSYSAKDFRTKAVNDLKKFIERLAGNLNPRPCPTYVGPVILSPRAIEEILLDVWLYHASGSQIMDGKSRWAHSIGKPVVAPLISIIDKPHDPTLDGSTAFDDDGIPTQDRSIIESGVLMTHILDCYSAKKLGVTTNGMAGGPFSLHIEGGKESLTNMLAARSEILLVDRFSGNTDPLTGDFSGVAKSSKLYQNGKEAGPVLETMIAGNIFDLAFKILAVSASKELVSGSFYSPYLLLDEVSVSG
jgi:PmbA protein